MILNLLITGMLRGDSVSWMSLLAYNFALGVCSALFQGRILIIVVLRSHSVEFLFHRAIKVMDTIALAIL
jgi:hypothetical protein